MGHLVSPGYPCYTVSEAQKLTERINKVEGVKVNEIRGVWIHYTHLKDPSSAKVRILLFGVSLRCVGQERCKKL